MYISTFLLALFAPENTSALQMLQLTCTRASPYSNKP